MGQDALAGAQRRFVPLLLALVGAFAAASLHHCRGPRIADQWSGQLLPPRLSDGLTGLPACPVSPLDYPWIDNPNLILGLWILSIVVGALQFARPTGPGGPQTKITGADLVLALAVPLAFSPIYLIGLYFIPFSINTDGVGQSSIVRMFSQAEYTDLHAVSTYLGFPALVFYAYSFVAQLMGEVTWVTMRLVHGLAGLTTIGLGYLLFRQIMDTRAMAVVATLILASQHVLLAISRTSMVLGSALLVEMLALVAVILGLAKRSLLGLFLAGALAGVGYYVYHPGRLIPIIIAAGLGILLLTGGQQLTRRWLTQSLFAFFIGTGLVVTPVIVSTVHTWETSTSYGRFQTLLTADGRAMQQEWVRAETPRDAVITNIRHGLSAFNSHERDHGNMYVNHGYGFLDPLSGILLWIGVLVSLFGRRGRPSDVIMLTGFLLIYLIMSFVTNKAPNYSRLLLSLPFVAYFVTQGMVALRNRLSKLVTPGHTALGRSVRGLPAVLLVAILAWNAYMYGQYATNDIKLGDDVGGTARYMEERRDLRPYRFYVVSSPDQMFYDWGTTGRTHSWLRAFTGPGQSAQMLHPDQLADEPLVPLLTLFMRRSQWRELKPELEARFEHISLRDLGQGRIAVEIGDAERLRAIRAAAKAPCGQFQGHWFKHICLGWRRWSGWL